jgi:hypothetical protein
MGLLGNYLKGFSGSPVIGAKIGLARFRCIRGTCPLGFVSCVRFSREAFRARKGGYMTWTEGCHLMRGVEESVWGEG